MAGRDLTFRVFVSSTFSDLAAERNALQDTVFPRLREFCAAQGARFQPIDLRWGVSEDAARDQQTIALCLEEIERCRQATPRPNFIALIGDRYGWRPLPRSLSVQAFEHLRSSASADDAVLLRRWYREDSNAVPPVFTLLSRVDASDPDVEWPLVEERLRAVIEQGLGRLPSATAQEIQAGVLDPAQDVDHAFAFTRRIENLADTATAATYRDSTPDGQPDAQARAQLADLESRLRTRLGQHVVEYQAFWTGDSASPITTSHLPRLCEDVYGRLSAVITDELSRHRTLDPLALELEPHERMMRRTGSVLSGREAECRAVLEWIRDPNVPAILVHGSWGSGKSAFAAHVASVLSRESPETTLIARFVGEDPSATTLRGLLGSLNRQIARHLDEPGSGASSADELVVRLREGLERLARQQPVVLLIDGLDLMAQGDSARTFYWLPGNIPARVTLLLSCSGGTDLKTLSRRLPAARALELGPLSVASAREVLRSALARVGRTLASSQWHAVDEALAANRIPLYVQLVGDEVCGWRSFDPAETLPVEISTLVQRHMARLAERRHHGAVLPERCLGFLAASKSGLAEDELLEVLSDDGDVMADFGARNPRAPAVSALPFIVWSRLRADLNRFLQERVADGATVLTFRQRQIEELLRRTLSAPAHYHAALQRYFARARTECAEPQRRALAELPYQELLAGDWDSLDATLTDVRFLEEKMGTGLGFDLLADFERLAELGTCSDHRIERCRVVGRALANVFDFVKDAPATLGPQLHLELQTGDVESKRDVLFTIEDGCAHRVWLFRYKYTANVRTCHEAQTAFDREYLHFLRFSPDGQSVLYGDVEGRLTRWNWSTGDRTETSVPARTAERGLLRSGALLRPSAFAFASERSVWILSLDDVWTGDLKRGVWARGLAAAPGEVFERLVADERSGQVLLAVQDERGHWLCEIGPSGATVASRRRIPDMVPNQKVNHIAVSAGGRPRALCLDSGHLIVSSGLTVSAHVGGALHCEFLGESQHVATCGVDGSLAVWDPRSGLLSRTELMADAAECLACAPTGRRIAVGHRDGQVSLVEWSQPVSLRVFSPGISGWALSLAFSPCGCYLAVGGRRGGLRVFDLEKVQGIEYARRLPQGSVVAATHLNNDGPCLFEDSDNHLYSTSERADTAQLPLKIEAHCLDTARGLALAVTRDRLRALDPESGAVAYEQAIPNAPRYAATMTPDGGTLALLEREGVTIWTWQADDRRWASQRTLSIPGRIEAPWRAGMPFLLSSDGTRLFLPLEPVVSGGTTADKFSTPDLHRRLAVLDTRTGEQLLSIRYEGFCTALAEWPLQHALVLGFGDGPVFAGSSYVFRHADLNARAHSLKDGTEFRRFGASNRPVKVAGLAIDATQQLLAFTSRDGQVFLQPLAGNQWTASVRLPTGALAPRFAAGGWVLWVPDDGRSNNHWPAEHHFMIRFRVPSSPEGA